jgi:uncharacterized protein (DUF433 family)
MDSVSETYRYIVRSAGVRSGNPIVESTRIAVHDVIGLLQNGETVDTVKANCFPQLARSQIYECLAYYEDHRGEIDLLIARQMAPPSEERVALFRLLDRAGETGLRNNVNFA